MLRSLIALLITTLLSLTVLGTSLSVYDVYDPLNGNFGFSIELSVDVWRYHAKLLFSPVVLSSNGSTFIVGKMTDPADVFEEIWFTSERLDVTYSEVPNPELSDPHVFMAGGKSLVVSLMNTVAMVTFPDGFSITVRSNGEIAGFTRITRSEKDGITSVCGLKLRGITLGIEDSRYPFVGISNDQIDLGISFEDVRRSWLLFKGRYSYIGITLGDSPSFRVVEKATPFGFSMLANSSGWAFSGRIHFGRSMWVFSLKDGKTEKMNIAFKLF